MRRQSDTEYAILIIGDDLLLQKVLCRLFSTEGFDVEVASDALTGVEILSQRSSCAVILDLKHPVSSECDLCRRIADLIFDAPLVLLSASSDPADRRLLLETGADYYLTIPFSPKQLATRLRVLMRRSARRGDLTACEGRDNCASRSEISRPEVGVEVAVGKGKNATDFI